MGSVTNQTDKQNFNPSDWRPIPIFSYTNINDPQYGSNFQALIHKDLPYLEAEKYDLFFNSQAEYISYLDCYYQRYKSDHLVSAIHIQKGVQKRMCSTFHSVELYLQRIPIRLYQIADMPIHEGLYLLNTALEGYQKMFPKTGYFDISSDMIGINKQGKVKVWVNKNLSKNFPQFNKINHNKQQADFIKRIVSIVEECVDYSGRGNTFREFLEYTTPALTFISVKAAVKQYSMKNKITISKLMKSILIVYRNHGSVINNSQSFNTISEGDNPISHQRKKEVYKAKPRRSVHKLEQSPQNFIKKQSLGDINYGALHMSFIKDINPYKECSEDLVNQSFKKNQIAEKRSGVPPVCFQYNSNMSPKSININSHHLRQIPETQIKFMQRVKQPRLKKKSQHSKRKSTQSKQGKQKIKKPIIFESTGESYQIDSDIAKDLQYLNL